jgi:hypothetical protein
VKTRENFLDKVPSIKQTLVTEKEGERSVIVFPRFGNKLLQKYLVPKHRSSHIRIRLDEHGTAVWELLDGRRTVGEICHILAGHFQDEADYEYRIITFLQQLRKQGFITFN